MKDISSEVENIKIDNPEVFHWKNSEISTQTEYITLIKIQQFKMFLKKKITFQTELFYFQSPISNCIFNFQVILIPSPDTLSIKIEFTPAMERRKQKEILKQLINENLNFVNIQLSLYSRVKVAFSYISDYKFCLYSPNNIIKEDFFMKEDYVRYQNKDFLDNRIFFPFILKVRLFQSRPLKTFENEIGLLNEGNTCYMNTIIQNIFHNPYLRNIIYNIKKDNDFLFCLQKILYKLQISKSPVKITEEINTKVKNGNFLSLLIPNSNINFKSQQDVHEIFGFILDALSSLDETHNIKNLFEVNTKVHINCEEINYESIKEEKFLFLSLDLCEYSEYDNEDKITLGDCVEKFLSVEKLDGENAYQSEKDNKKYNAIKTISFIALPPILFFHLKRFNTYQTKSLKEIVYKDELDLSMYYNNDINDYKYTLYSVTVHEGRINNGHYFVYIKNFKERKWMKFNDSIVSYVLNEKEVFEDNYGGYLKTYKVSEDGKEIFEFPKEKERTAYIFCYILNSKINDYFIKAEINIPKELKDYKYNITKQKSITNFIQRKYNSNKENGGMNEERKIQTEKEYNFETIKFFQNSFMRTQEGNIFNGRISNKTISYNLQLKLFDNNEAYLKELNKFNINVEINSGEIFSPSKILKSLKEHCKEFQDFINEIPYIKLILTNKFNLYIKWFDISNNEYNMSNFLYNKKIRGESSINLYLIKGISLYKNSHCYVIQKLIFVKGQVTPPYLIFSKEALEKELKKQEYSYKNLYEITSTKDEIQNTLNIDKLKKKPFNIEEMTKHVIRILSSES